MYNFFIYISFINNFSFVIPEEVRTIALFWIHHLLLGLPTLLPMEWYFKPCFHHFILYLGYIFQSFLLHFCLVQLNECLTPVEVAFRMMSSLVLSCTNLRNFTSDNSICLNFFSLGAQHFEPSTVWDVSSSYNILPASF